MKTRRRKRTHTPTTKLPKWAIRHITEVAQKTGFQPHQILDDILKAGAVALKDQYRSIVTHRESIESLWNEPVTANAKIAQPRREDVEETLEPTDWTPDLGFSRNSKPQAEDTRIGLERFSTAEVGRGQLAESPANPESAQLPAGDDDSGGLTQEDVII